MVTRTQAINYLQRKGKISEPYKERKFTEEEERKIEEVMKEGDIYGDPHVKIS